MRLDYNCEQGGRGSRGSTGGHGGTKRKMHVKCLAQSLVCGWVLIPVTAVSTIPVLSPKSSRPSLCPKWTSSLVTDRLDGEVRGLSDPEHGATNCPSWV